MKDGWLLLGCAVLWATAGCRNDMANQPRMKPYRPSEVFNNGTSARPLPPHTVSREGGEEESVLFTGLEVDGNLAVRMPVPLDRALLERGRERFDIYCSVCHGAAGEANGMIVQRGFPQPPSLHEARLREVPLGYFVHVIRNGYGVMYPYADRVEPRDRWAIAAYVRVLQASRQGTLEDVPAQARQKLEANP